AGQRGGERRARVLRPFREKRGVRVTAVRLALVIAELGGGLLPGSHPGPDGDRADDRLEVEEAKPALIGKGLQLARQRWLHDDAPLSHRLELAPLREVELLGGREITEGRYAALQVGDGLLRACG